MIANGENEKKETQKKREKKRENANKRELR